MNYLTTSCIVVLVFNVQNKIKDDYICTVNNKNKNKLLKIIFEV